MNPRNDIATVRIGDRVRVNLAYFVHERHLNGQEGEVVTPRTLGPLTVRLDSGQQIETMNVTEVEAPVEVLIDARRIQAVQAAKAILGDPLVEDLRTLAEWLLVPAAEPLADWEKELLNATAADQRAKAGGPDPAAEALQAARDADAMDEGFRMGELTLRYDGTVGDVLETPEGYLKRDGVVALIEFAQAALRHFDRQQAPVTPF